MPTYCDYVKTLKKSDPNYIHKIYHDTEYGFPLKTDNQLFGRLILEINQAGLSWTTILKKKDNFKRAYSDFDVVKIAKYKQTDIDRLLNDAGIIRNKLKIKAAILNAQKILEIQSESGSFKKWLEDNKKLTKLEWVKLFKKTFYFTGGEIVNEFLMSIGILDTPHTKDCPIFHKLKSSSKIGKNG